MCKRKGVRGYSSLKKSSLLRKCGGGAVAAKKKKKTIRKKRPLKSCDWRSPLTNKCVSKKTFHLHEILKNPNLGTDTKMDLTTAQGERWQKLHPGRWLMSGGTKQ
jgi:hypothetical protein